MALEAGVGEGGAGVDSKSDAPPGSRHKTRRRHIAGDVLPRVFPP